LIGKVMVETGIASTVEGIKFMKILANTAAQAIGAVANAIIALL